jgi:hypothetical protein
MGISTQEYQKLLENVNKAKGVDPKKGEKVKVKKTKFNNIVNYYDGKKFDSKKECERYKELKHERVKDLKCQVPYKIVVNDVKICNYIADFVYIDHKGKTVVEDVKSEHTRKLPVYRLKKKLLKACYGIDIKEV